MNPQPHTPNFNRVARIYRWAEYAALGSLLRRVRTYFLPQLDGARTALILGDGDGRFLAAFLRRNQHVHATAVDASETMLQLLKRRCRFADDRLDALLNPLETFDATRCAAPDLIVTHFVLDCLPQSEVDAVVHHLSTCAKPGALWLISDFGLPQRGVFRIAARLYIRTLYAAFRVLTGLRTHALPDHAFALARAGFHRIARKQWARGFLFSELWQLQPTQPTPTQPSSIQPQRTPLLPGKP